MNADDFNDRELRAGNIHPDDITRITRVAQKALGILEDGKFGADTRAALLAHIAVKVATTSPLTIDANGWLVGDGVTIIKAHPSWFGRPMGDPKGVVCHVSATNHGTGINMAKNRARPFVRGEDRLSSWHASVEADGALIQMVPFNVMAWHAGSSTAKPIPGLGSANHCTNGIELVGWEKGPFPEKQVIGYARLLRALRLKYGIKREHAMITHASIDPTRRSDPGAVWMRDHAERVLELAFA